MPRFLLIAPIYVVSTLSGGGQRTRHIFRALRQRGPVDLMLVSEPLCEPLERTLPQLSADYAGAESIGVVRSTPQFVLRDRIDASRLQRWKLMAERLYHAVRPRRHFFEASGDAQRRLFAMLADKPYDVIVCRLLRAAALSGALQQRKIPVVVDLDDLDEVVLGSRLQSPTTSLLRRLMLRSHAGQVRRVATGLRRRCAHVFTATAADQTYVAHRSSSVLANIPLRPDGFRAPDDAVASAVVLFVGSCGHRPNEDGVRHFVAACWPAIRQKMPAATFRIVGSGGWEALRGEFEAIDGVEVVGLVEDLHGEYAAAALCVSPVFEGAGSKIKILEALMYGRVVVAAAHSVRGFDDLFAAGVVPVEGDAEMAETCVALLADPARRARASADAPRMIAERYSPESFAAVVHAGLDAVAAAR